MKKNKKHDGKWENGGFRLIVKGNRYVSFYKGFRYGKGTIDFSNGDFVLQSTHAHWKFFFWVPFAETVKGKCSFPNSEINVSNIEGRYSDYNGIWKRIRCVGK